MAWRDLVRRREERHERENRDGTSLTQAAGIDHERPWLALLIAGVSWVIYALMAYAEENFSTTARWIMTAMLVCAAGIAIVVARAHRAKGKQELRGAREPDALTWEEDHSA